MSTDHHTVHEKFKHPTYGMSPTSVAVITLKLNVCRLKKDKRICICSHIYSVFMIPLLVCVREKDAAVLTDRMESLNAT